MIINAETNHIRTLYYADGMSLEPNIDHLSQILQHTRLPENAVAQEMHSIRREAMTALDDTDNAHYLAAEHAMFGAPYGRDTLGHHKSLNFGAEKLTSVYRQQYKLARMALIVSGNASLNEAVDLASRYFHADESPYDIKHDTPLPTALSTDYTSGLIRPDSRNVRLQISYPLSPEFRKRIIDNELVFDIASAALSDAAFQLLRQEKAISYDGSVEFSMDNHHNTWHLSGHVTVDKSDVAAARNAFDDLFSRDESRYNETSLQGTLNVSKYALNHNFATVSKRTSGHIGQLDLGKQPQDLEIDLQELDNLTTSDIRGALNEIIDYTGKTPHYTHLTGKRKSIGTVDRIIENDDFS
ncbi:MAG: insulinase family protein, partial [Candidatus Saccharimonadales bacterium]